ncbi:unnamed protein product [Peniophora sp. CBMAI 1063]|nr:unnamed protein product [Peniophora sp. CBMAI 1063]
MIPITCNAVGDILALATLFLDIARALDESRGSPAKWRALNSELKSLHIVLASVARVAENTTDTLLRGEIVREVNRCGDDVRRALERAAEFSVLGRDESPDDVCSIRMKRQWYKLKWRFGYHGSAESIREELAAAIQRLTAYLVVSNADKIHSLGASITEQFTATSAQICTLLLQQFEIVAMRDAERSRTVNGHIESRRDRQLSAESTRASSGSSGDVFYGLDSSKAAAAALLCLAICTMHDTSRAFHSALLLAAFAIVMKGMARDSFTVSLDVRYGKSNSVLLDDAMGRQLVLPIELCETPQLLHATLVNLFSPTSGSWFINSRNYAVQVITREGDHREFIDGPQGIPGANWEFFGTAVSVTARRQHLDWYSQVHPFTRITLKLRSATHFPGDRREYHNDLHLAALNGHYEMVNGLLAGGLDVNVADPSGRTALHAASVGGHLSVVLLLLDYGAIINIAEDSMTPLACALQCDNFDVAELLVSRDALSSLSMASKTTLLYFAARSGHIQMARILLSLGTDVNCRLDIAKGHTALHAACDADGFGAYRRQIIRLLLQNGADVFARSENGDTPLSIVACKPSKLFQLLVPPEHENEVTLNWSAWWPREGLDLLWRAVDFGNCKLIASLLQTGIDINSRLRGGDTPLSLTLRFPERYEIVKLLLERGADVNAPTPDDSTPLCIALTTAKHYRKSPSRPANGYYPLSEEYDPRTAELLLAWGAIPDEKSSILMRANATWYDRPWDNLYDASMPGAWREDQ